MTSNIIYTQKTKLSSTLNTRKVPRVGRGKGGKLPLLSHLRNRPSFMQADLAAYLMNPDLYCDCCGATLVSYLEFGLCRECDARHSPNPRVVEYLKTPSTRGVTYLIPTNTGYSSLDKLIEDRYGRFKRFFLAHPSNKELGVQASLDKMYDLSFEDYLPYCEEFRSTDKTVTPPKSLDFFRTLLRP